MVPDASLDASLDEPASRGDPEQAAADVNDVGVCVPGYRVLEALGQGAEGVALAAVHEASGRKVVLKRVGSHSARAVRRSFEVLGKVASPHLPAPHGLVEGPGDVLWLATRWVAGRPLQPGPAPLVDAIDVARQVAHGLAALHEAGTHHGDLSPANVVLDETGRAVVVDLGQLGRQGTGTPGFVAPETLGGGGGPPADLFSLGCLLWWQWTGEPLWRRPEALVKVKDAGDVRQAIQARAPIQLSPVMASLLERLLHPDPHRRPARARDVVRRLEQVQTDLQQGRAPSPWWIPTRLPYRGIDLAAVAEAIEGGAKLIAVAGPRGSGRGRTVEAIVEQAQGRGKTGTLVEPRAAGSSWLQGWMASADGPGVVGVLDDPQGNTEQADEAQFVATLRAAAELSPRCCVLPVSDTLAKALDDVPGVTVVHVRPWTDREIEGCVLDVLVGPDAGRVQSFVDALRRTTGGWPGSVVTAVLACAQTRVEEPSAAAIEEALEAVGGDRLGLDAPLASDVLQLRWEPGSAVAARLPAHLHDGTRPRAEAVAAAKRRLGEQVQVLARAHARDRAKRALPPSLLVSLDAGLTDDVVQALQREEPLRPDTSLAAELLSWAQAEPDVPPAVRAVAGRLWLARGRADRAIALLRGHTEDLACALQAARAWQRLGKTTEALRLLERLATEDEPWRSAAIGLQLRVLVDRGELERSEAIASKLDPSSRGPGAAGMWLWAAYTAVIRGAQSEAGRRLELAMTALGEASDEPAWSMRARIEQLSGNLRHDQGDLAAARRAYEAALESFERAGDAAGSLAVRGSLSALCVATMDLQRGVELGRSVLRGLLAGNQVSALPEAAMNLVQLLRRLGALDEAARVHAAARELAEHRPPVSELVRGRLGRIAADVEATRLAAHRVPAKDGAAWKTAERMFSIAARHLEASAAIDEAADAWLQAAAIARAGRRIAAAKTHWSRAAALREQVSAPLSVAIAAERLRQGAAAEEPQAALREHLQELDAALDAKGEQRARTRPHASGRLELAWVHDRALWAALRQMAQPTEPRRRAVATRLVTTLEEVMKKTPSMDRPAVRDSLTAEAGEPDVLSELLEDSQGAAPAQSPASAATGRTDRLLRMYRRFAREERLEPLLEQVVDAMMDLTEAERGAVVIVQPAAGTGDAKAAAPSERMEVTRELSAGTEGFRFSRSVIDRVLQTGEPVLSVDAAADERFDGSRSISHLNLRSVLAVPLRFRGRLLGAAYVDHRLRRGNFDDGDLAHMEAFGELAALAVAHAQILGEVRDQARKLEAQGRELEALLEAREAEVVELREEVRQRVGQGAHAAYRGLVGSSPAMRRVLRLIDRLADTDVPVVVFGESGTGKELVARAIHDAGVRAKGPFVAENCGAIPETLLESILFGHAKGAFTGAAKTKTGLFEAANGGTIFLDEVSEMSPAMQTKLLRVLQEGEVRRVGENAPRSVDVRVITASNKDLEALVEQGAFRRDLYYRINVVRIDLPPLRDRVEDLPALVEHLAHRHAPGRTVEVTPPAMRLLSGYAWPGNVRELENEVQRWLALSDGKVGIDDLSPSVLGRPDMPAPDHDDLAIRPRVERLERELIARALERTEGNQTKAAELLGLSRYGLQKKLKRLDD